MADKAELAITRFEDEDAFEKSLHGGGGGKGLIWSIPKDRDLNVRFLVEPTEWISFGEIWDGTQAYPALAGEEAPDGGRISQRYLAPAVDLDYSAVIIVKLPKILTEDLWGYAHKFGSITDRPYALARSGEGLNTKYKAMTDRSASDFPTDQYDVPDLVEALMKERERVIENNPF